MKFEAVHCLFEQSGTFKNEFEKFGIESYDYDIRNDFGETDYIIDLFTEIENGYKCENSIFDDFTQDDLIIAFFPCVRFENQINLHFRGQSYAMRKWSNKQKLLNCMKLHSELDKYYQLINKLLIICIDRNLKLILENPYSKEHYLTRYWCIKPSIIDYDRRKSGDYFKKPTQFYFLNVTPKNNTLSEPIKNNAIEIKDAIRCLTKKDCYKIGAKNVKVARSMIAPDYANSFIRRYIL